ncbi:NUDIX domain-containing protein [Ornithinimicrobium murale]|uniref:NUDIX domain-containing protein n=1 Tax=Ornithinimicrobium murale TaxID=1050153 RepID=UPI000E0CE4CA|nr:NUDIX domain-containing protein [Ornithinimicrobium murale]
MSGQVVLAASAVITDAAGRVLLIRRGTEPGRGLWSVPGGSLDPGETFEEAAAREAFEETGLIVEVGRELWRLRVPVGDGRVYEIHDFAATVTGGTLVPGDDAEDARWVSPEEIDTLAVTDDLAGYLRRAGIIPPAPLERCGLKSGAEVE